MTETISRLLSQKVETGLCKCNILSRDSCKQNIQKGQPVIGNGTVNTFPQQQIKAPKIEELMETAFSVQFVPPAFCFSATEQSVGESLSNERKDTLWPESVNEL
jgi:hypothetical protein